MSNALEYGNIPSSQGITEEMWINIDWIWKDESLNNPIKLFDIGINWTLLHTVEELTNDIDLSKLLSEIGKRKI